MFLIALPLGASAEVLKGDVNGDGTVSIKDVTVLINYLLTDDPIGVNPENADTYEDGVINIHDLTGLIEILLTMPDEPQPVEHEYVDLGLPSGTLWATCNVGANAPEEYGDYFAWGETETKEVYTWTTYKWCNGSGDSLTKYCTDSSYGYNGCVDNKTELDPEDDAAYVNWGPSWRMPSREQFNELRENCSEQWIQRNGVYGCLLTGSNGNSLFLSAAGILVESGLIYEGIYSSCWSHTLGHPDYSPQSKSYMAYQEFFYSEVVYGWYYRYDRYFGRSVRPVYVPQD